MILYSSSALSFMSAWECGEYIAEIVVIIGCVGEYLAEFTDRLTGGIETRKRRLSRLSLLILIIGLAVGLASLMGATITSGREIAALNVKASEANERSRKLELATVTLESDMKFRTALETLGLRPPEKVFLKHFHFKMFWAILNHAGLSSPPCPSAQTETEASCRERV